MTNNQVKRDSDICEELEKISLRLSLSTSEEKYESFVNKSLPILIRYIAHHENHRKKILEILGDIIRNVKSHETLDLPVIELFSLYNDKSKNTFLQNFSYLYLKLGYPRKPLTAQAELLSLLFNSLSEDKPIVQKDALLHLTFPVLRYISNINFNKHEMRLAESHYQRRYIAEFYTLVLLLPYDYIKCIQFSNVDVCLVDGMSIFDFNRLVNEKYSTIFPNCQLENYKAAIVSFFSRGIFTPEESIIPILFANADTRHSVVSLASKELRILSYEVDWEDSNLLSSLMDWYLGRSREFDPIGHLLKMRNPLSSRMRVKLTPYLLRSRITLPGPLIADLISAILLGLTSAMITSRNVVKQGLLNHEGVNKKNLDSDPIAPANGESLIEGSDTGNSANPNSVESNKVGMVALMQHRKLAEHSLDLLQHLITYSRLTCSSTTSAALHCLVNFICEKSPDEFNNVRIRGLDLLAKIFNRQLFFLLSEPLQLPRLFDLLCQDISLDLKKAVGKCLIRLSSCLEKLKLHYYATFKNQFAKLEEILFENIEKNEVICRLVALCYAETIYDSDHIPTRYLILQALSDSDPSVKYQAKQIFAPFFSPEICYEIVFGKIKLPGFVEFVNHDTNHPRQNPFVDVERLVPVVRFIRLCLLAEQGGLTSNQELEMTYESEDEFRYRINQNVRHFLMLQQQKNQSSEDTCSSSQNTDEKTSISSKKSDEDNQYDDEISIDGGSLSQTNVEELLEEAGNLYARVSQGSESSKKNEKSSLQKSSSSNYISPEKARRCIDTYFRLIQVVIFTRSRNNKESNDFPKFLEEVLVNNTKDLLINGKQLFERINTVLLISSRGASCRHACASVYSVVIMETQPPQDALKTALAMLPEDVAVLDNDMSHCLQGMCMGTAYLLERLYQTYYTGEDQKKTTEPVKTTENTSKKNKKGSQTSVNEPNEISQQILVGIQKLLNIINQFLIPPTYLGAQKITATSHTTVFENKFSNINVTRNTITALLEALQVLGESGALSDLLVSRPPSGPVKENSRPPLIASKQAFLHRIASYLPPNLSLGSSEKGTSGQMEENYDDIKKLVEAAIRTMVSICIGEKVKTPGIALYILKALINTVKVKEPRIQLSVGTALADVLLGYHTPFKGHWYQRKYPLKVGPPEIVKECLDPALNPDAEWLNKKLIEFLTPLPGQVTTRRETISAAIWCLAIVKRISAPLHGLIPIDSIIGLLKEKEVHIQCIGAACFGLIFDSSSEEEKAILQEKLAKYIEDNKESTSIYVELYELAKSINRPDLALTLFVMSISSFFKDTEHDSCLKKSLAKLLSEIVPSLLRRLGKNLAPALPQLVPQIYISRFVKSWPDLQRGMESIWRGLVVYADASNSSFNYTKQATHSSSEQFVVEIDVKNSEENLSPSNSSPGNADTRNVDSSLSYFYEEIDSNRINKHVDSNKKSFYSQLTNLIEAHFNAIVCDIKSLLGFISSAHNSPETNNLPQTNSIILGNSPTSQQLKDACCFAIVALCKHPSAERKLAGHLPALLAGLLMMIESSKSDPAPGSEFSLANKSEQMIPAEKACIAVQKMVLQVFENPSSREAAIFLFPGLLPVLIETTISMPFGMNNPIKLNVDGLSKAPSYLTEDSESKKLSLDIILAAVRVSNASSLRSILPILILAGLHTMAYLPPNRICSLIRQPIAAANAMNVSQISTNTGSQNQPRQGTNTAANRAKEINKNEVLNVIPTCFSREIQMAEILNICIRLIDDICLSELVITFTELIRLGGIIPDKNSSQHHCGLKSVSVSVAVCVLITQLAARCSWVRRHHSYIAPKNIPQGNKNSVLPPQLPINNINRLVNQTFRESTSTKRQTTNNSNSSQSSSSQSSPNVEKNPTESFTLATTRPEAEQKMNDSSSEMAVGNLNLAPYAGKLLAALLAALPGGSRHTDSVRIEMNRAVVSLLGFAKESTVAKLLNRVTGWYLDIVVGNGESEEIRYYHELACVTTLLTIVNHSHQVVQKHASLFLPIIFIAKQKEDDIFHNFERANYIMMFSLAGRMMAMTMNLCLANTKWKATEPWCVGMPMKNDAHLDFISMRNKWYVLWVDAQAVYMSHCHTTHSKYREATSQLEAKSEDEQDNQTAQSAIGENIPLETMIKPDNFVSLRNQTFVVKSNMFPAIIATIEQVICGPNQTMHWPIRTQAALALWSLSVSLIEANNSITLKWAEEANEELLLNAADLAAAMVSDERPLLVSKKDRKSISKRLQQKSTEITSENSSPEDAEKNEEDSSASTNKFNLEELHANHKAWVELARVTIASLKETKPWAGKIYIIRSAALLCFYACDRDLSIEEPKLLKDLFLACVNESRKKRALKAVSCMGALDLVSDDEASSYRVEAIFACSCVLEALDQGMQISIENDENEEFGSETSLSTKLITRLCRIILTKFNLKNNSLLPYNTKKEDDEKHKKPIVINKHLNDNELQVAMLTLTLLWPESRTEQDLKIFADLLEFLVTVIQEVSTDVQIATLHTLIEILNKVSPQDFETATRNGQDGASVDKLKRIMTVLIKQLESFSFQSSNFGLQEQSLKVLSAIVFHPNLITSFKEPIEKMICHFMKQSKSTATGLQDLAAQLHGKLQITKFY